MTRRRPKRKDTVLQMAVRPVFGKLTNAIKGEV